MEFIYFPNTSLKDLWSSCIKFCSPRASWQMLIKFSLIFLYCIFVIAFSTLPYSSFYCYLSINVDVKIVITGAKIFPCIFSSHINSFQLSFKTGTSQLYDFYSFNGYTFKALFFNYCGRSCGAWIASCRSICKY